MKKIKKPQVSRLWKQYQNIKFSWSGNAMEATCFAILTAYNPRSRVQEQIINRIKQQKLSNYLMVNKIPFTPIMCGNTDFSYCEPSLAIAIDSYKITNLAKTYDQNAFYSVESGNLYLRPALLKNTESKYLGKFADFLAV